MAEMNLIDAMALADHASPSPQQAKEALQILRAAIGKQITFVLPATLGSEMVCYYQKQIHDLNVEVARLRQRDMHHG